MNEIYEGVQIPSDTPPSRQEVLDTLEEKDYPSDTNFFTLVISGVAGLIRLLGELLFGAGEGNVEKGASGSAETSGDIKERPTDAAETSGDIKERPADAAGTSADSSERPADARESFESTERKAAEIMAEVFDRNTLERWPAMDMREREAKLEEYYFRLADALGIPATKLSVEDLNPGGTLECAGLFKPETGMLYIDYRIVEDPEWFAEMLDTVVHETRHQFQHNVVMNPEAYPEVPRAVVEEWAGNMPPPWSNYYDWDTYGEEMYLNQPIERDANVFAEGVLTEYVGILNGQ